jgi:LAO/AO transport system kinase
MSSPANGSSLFEGILEGSRLSLSRLLTQVENATPEGRAALGEVFPHTGRAHLIGVTGAPGTGKSSFVNQLARHYRTQSQPRRVAIIAVDPSSPFTGGAILGDRVRMRDLSGDPGVFIRSMAARGSLGGLAAATADMAQVFDAAGFETILIETVGAGQSEVDIARLAHTTVVVEAPGLGDDIQAIKAGILEIADILVVNKADQPGAENTERALRSMLELAHPTAHIFRAAGHHRWADAPQPPANTADIWMPPIQKTVATRGDGIPEVTEAIARHRQYLEQTGEWQRRERLRLQSELETLVQETLLARWRAGLPETRYQEALNALVERKISPHAAAQSLIQG